MTIFNVSPIERFRTHMCGIAGLTLNHSNTRNVADVLSQMGQAIRHRGPDSAGQYQDEGVGLCHQRLSIIDLSSGGHQPMRSHSGRFVITYNGEIYNFVELRNSLIDQGVVFRSNSDTEVLIQLFEKMGTKCLDLLNGMFAIAIWDTTEKTLFLARDRLGKKPLYYYANNGDFVFASEIKSILTVPDIDRSIRYDAVKDYFTYHYVPDPKSIFKFIHKLKPGHWLRVANNDIKEECYWDVSFSKGSEKSLSNVKEDLYNLIDDSVRIRMMSDVPLGAFLSGGVDSSAMVGMMANAQSSPITTCSIGFKSEKHNELEYAKEIANQFGTDHHEFIVNENVENSLLEIANYFDEPFADSSFVPTYFVSKLARRKVTVALAGDGGDENFAGYTKYGHDKKENELRKLLPGPIRRALLPTLHSLLVKPDNKHTRRMSSLLGTLSVDSARGFFKSNSFFNEYIWSNLINDKFKTALGGYDSAENTINTYQQSDGPDHLSKILYTDIKTYLPGDILVKVDRMSMANSLETRAPLLDYRVVEYAATIPSSLKLNGKESKYALKKCLSSLLSDEILYRKKMGFTVPMEQWLRNEINLTVHKYLFKQDNGLSQFFDPRELQKLWDLHQSGKLNLSQELWSLFMFEVWWQKYITN